MENPFLLLQIIHKQDTTRVPQSDVLGSTKDTYCFSLLEMLKIRDSRVPGGCGGVVWH